jgi:hypothetical protein
LTTGGKTKETSLQPKIQLFPGKFRLFLGAVKGVITGTLCNDGIGRLFAHTAAGAAKPVGG